MQTFTLNYLAGNNIIHYTYRDIALHACLIDDVDSNVLWVTCSDVTDDVIQLVGRREWRLMMSQWIQLHAVLRALLYQFKYDVLIIIIIIMPAPFCYVFKSHWVSSPCSRAMNAEQRETAADFWTKPSRRTWAIGPPVYRQLWNYINHHYLLLLSPILVLPSRRG